MVAIVTEIKPRGVYRTYIPRKFGSKVTDLIRKSNAIIANFQAQGYDLTLRQLYYQLVAGDVIANSPKEYNRLGEIIAAARLAGLVSWTAITDRTRNLRNLSYWGDPAEITRSAAASYRIDKWADQPYRIEVWVEKDAQIGTVARAAEALDVPCFSCRGYTSLSEMWEAGERLKRHAGNGQAPLIIHLGDHDPSGIDMTRDITDRLDMFTGGVPVERIALNYDQVLQYNPPPNPAKMTDSRFEAYQAEHGNESWELDALAPNVIGTMITEAILARRDEAKWAAQEAEEEEGRAKLLRISDHYRALADLLDPDLPDGAVAHGIDMGAEAAREWEGSE